MSKRRQRPLWELRRELKRRLRTMRPWQVNRLVMELREFACAHNFFRDGNSIETITQFDVATAMDKVRVEQAIRQQAQVKR